MISSFFAGLGVFVVVIMGAALFLAFLAAIVDLMDWLF